VEKLITDSKTLAALAVAGLVIWPVKVNNGKNKFFKYVNDVNDQYKFSHKGKNYRLKYHDGCFYPFVYEIQ
jgi:hypothetical protein